MKSRKLDKSRVVKHTIYIKGHKTNVTLEDQFWEALKEIAKERGSSVSALVTKVTADRGNANLSSAIRVFVLRYYEDRISAIQTPST